MRRRCERFGHRRDFSQQLYRSVFMSFIKSLFIYLFIFLFFCHFGILHSDKFLGFFTWVTKRARGEIMFGLSLYFRVLQLCLPTRVVHNSTHLKRTIR